MPSSAQKLRRDALDIFRSAVAAVDAGDAVHRHLAMRGNVLRAGNDVPLSLEQFDRVFVIAAGKAALAMASAVQKIVGDRLSGGIVVTKHGHAAQRLRQLRVIEAGHPIPDAAGSEAVEAVDALLRELNARDLLIVAVSGGASALLPAPVLPVSLKAKQRTTDLLLRAGADIYELNAVRKHLSVLKGGGLAALAYPATVVSLLLSDVIGDPLDVIGSGLTAPDHSTFAEAVLVLEKYGLLERVPRSVRERLIAGVAGDVPESPKEGDLIFKNVHNVVIGSNRLALNAAAQRAKQLGYRPLILSSCLTGETRDVARVHAQIVREMVDSGHPVSAPACIVSGGETTVTVRGAGKGGRNQEFALAAALELNGLPNALVLSGGTDGTDGPTDAAGAIATGDTVRRASLLGLPAAEHLRENNAYPFFDALGDLVKTGPTGTNVMDVHLLLVGKS